MALPLSKIGQVPTAQNLKKKKKKKKGDEVTTSSAMALSNWSPMVVLSGGQAKQKRSLFLVVSYYRA